MKVYTIPDTALDRTLELLEASHINFGPPTYIFQVKNTFQIVYTSFEQNSYKTNMSRIYVEPFINKLNNEQPETK